MQVTSASVNSHVRESNLPEVSLGDLSFVLE